jgi:hypothetical protein
MLYFPRSFSLPIGIFVRDRANLAKPILTVGNHIDSYFVGMDFVDNTIARSSIWVTF